MKFWALMLIMDLIIPFIMIGFGVYLLNSARGIKELFGYKTAMMIKNRDTEKFAFDFCRKYYIFIGLIMVPISVKAMTTVISDTTGKIALIGGMICLVQGLLFADAPLVAEIVLKKTFDKDGNRR